MPTVLLKPLQLLPAIDSRLLQLRNPEGQGAHEIIPAGQIPVPDLHRQPPVFVCLLQLAGREQRRDGFILEALEMPSCLSTLHENVDAN